MADLPPAPPLVNTKSTSESEPLHNVKLMKTCVAVVVAKKKPLNLQKSTDIRSFFASTTAPYIPISSPPATAKLGSSPFKNSSRAISRARLNNNKIKNPRPMSQLILDLSNRPTTQICKECGMSFVLGVEEDVELHRKHHRRVVEGVEWPLTLESQPNCRVVWREPGGMDEEKIVKVSLDSQMLKRSGCKAKVEQILEMVNRSLDAQELTEDQLRASALYLYLGRPVDCSSSALRPIKKRRLTKDSVTPKNQKKKVVVKAMCVAARIEDSYQIVRGPDTPTDVMEDRELLRFGDTTSELYCSPKREKALVGIHRIWSAPYCRRAGLGRRLLNAVAETFIYGMPIEGLVARRQSIAFSQPTESGMRLAANWFQTVLFKIFMD